MDGVFGTIMGIPVGILCLIGGILFMKLCKAVWRIWVTVALVAIGAILLYLGLQEPLGLPELRDILTLTMLIKI